MRNNSTKYFGWKLPFELREASGVYSSRLSDRMVESTPGWYDPREWNQRRFDSILFLLSL